MPKRYYLCDVEVFNNGDFDEIRPVLPRYNVTMSVVLDLANNRSLVIIDAANHSDFLSSQTMDAMPIFPLDGKVNAMQNTAKNKMIADIGARGFVTDVNGADGYRDVIRGIGLELDSNFNENNFDANA